MGHQVRYNVIRGGRQVDTINGFRYADDVVFILKHGDDAKLLRESIDQLLATRGLKVKEAKTRLNKSTEGFDFLGSTFCVKPNGKFISTPSRKSTKAIKAKVKEVLKDSRYTLEQRIDKCGSVIRGWKNYHKYCDMSSHELWSARLWTWKFICKQGSYDRHRTNQAIKRVFPKVSWSVNSFVKVKGDKSPFNGDMIYWSKRVNANYDGLTAKLLSKQKHTCTHCKLNFYPGDTVELHHKDGDHKNWKLSNLAVLHRECHQHQAVQGEVRVGKTSSPLKGSKAC